MKQKFFVTLAIGASLFSATSHLVAATVYPEAPLHHKVKQPSKLRLSLDNQGLALEAILRQVSQDFPDYRDFKEEETVYGRGFFSRLSSQYGFTYAKRSLPTLIYQELAPYFADRLSQDNFLQTWDETIQLATSSDFERAFTKNLKNKKVPASLATGAAKVVATTVSELL